jgi:hypothetical protein
MICGSEKENVLLVNKHILICPNEQLTNLDKPYLEQLEHIKNNFCGIVLYDIESFNDDVSSTDTIVFLCGRIRQNYEKIKLVDNRIICIIRELSEEYYTVEESPRDLSRGLKNMTLGKSPLRGPLQVIA